MKKGKITAAILTGVITVLAGTVSAGAFYDPMTDEFQLTVTEGITCQDFVGDYHAFVVYDRGITSAARHMISSNLYSDIHLVINDDFARNDKDLDCATGKWTAEYLDGAVEEYTLEVTFLNGLVSLNAIDNEKDPNLNGTHMGGIHIYADGTLEFNGYNENFNEETDIESSNHVLFFTTEDFSMIPPDDEASITSAEDEEIKAAEAFAGEWQLHSIYDTTEGTSEEQNGTVEFGPYEMNGDSPVTFTLNDGTVMELNYYVILGDICIGQDKGNTSRVFEVEENTYRVQIDDKEYYFRVPVEATPTPEPSPEPQLRQVTIHYIDLDTEEEITQIQTELPDEEYWFPEDYLQDYLNLDGYIFDDETSWVSETPDGEFEIAVTPDEETKAAQEAAEAETKEAKKGRNPWYYDGSNGQQIFDRIMNINWGWSDVTIDWDAGTFEGTAFENELKGTIDFEGDSIVLHWTEGEDEFLWDAEDTEVYAEKWESMTLKEDHSNLAELIAEILNKRYWATYEITLDEANGSGTAYTEDFDETTEFTYSFVDLDGEEVVEIHYLKDDSVFTNADVRP